MQRLGLQYSGGRTPAARQRARSSSTTAASRSSGPATRPTRRPRSRRRRSSAATRSSRAAPTTCCTPSSSSRRTGRPIRSSSRRRRTSCSEQGSRLQQQGRQVSAERLFASAPRSSSPANVEALVAKAVGLFDEDNLTPAFSHLGPLSARFPKSQIVHYYLGYLLAWTAQGQAGDRPVREDASSSGPTTEIGKAATKFLAGIAALAGSGS